ncbi:hypothetical protein VTL71DRAFT_1912 [Oculimacula yallundae]|uniref:Uncharacterized protein n=1 Tax=Oculimacula yallundae TaxID=86028 RepID=A0ABR4CD84_9HELO
MSALNGADTVLRPPGSRDTFFATAVAVSETSDWLSSLLTVNATIAVNTNLINLDFISTSNGGLVSPLVTAMNRSTTGFPDLMDSLARSLSYGLRTMAYQPPPVLGLAFSTTTRASVRRPWLILPLLLLAASLAVLVAVMVDTKRKGLIPWTNSILAVLFHGIENRPSGHQGLERG